MTAYERALQELSRANPKDFVAERERLAATLRPRDKGNAARLELRRRPTGSVWAVNQLYWQARDAFDELLSAASALRKGDVSARRAYRAAIETLHRRVVALLEDAGLGASDATLRRIDTTMAAIAAAGGFAPNPPGALEKDLDPPGFDAVGVPARPTTREGTARTTRTEPASAAQPGGKRRSGGEASGGRAAEERHRRREERERVRAHQAEKKRRDRELAERKAQRDRLERSLRTATRNLERSERAVAVHEKQLRDAEERALEARRTATDLERRLADLATRPSEEGRARG